MAALPATSTCRSRRDDSARTDDAHSDDPAHAGADPRGALGSVGFGPTDIDRSVSGGADDDTPARRPLSLARWVGRRYSAVISDHLGSTDAHAHGARARTS